MKASIIVRTKNEERWIASCLRRVFSQAWRDFEVILVDNRSTDKTLERAKAFDVRVLQIDDYLPGKALNLGIRASTGDIIVCLSGHCIPADSDWLGNLLRNFEDPSVAGVYGRQKPMSYSSDMDKRDLITIFGPERRVQRKDSFFHNANSAIRRSLWDAVPFSETVTNVEDRVWAKEILARNHCLVYEPEAAVYHYHGIHQDGNPERCRNVVRILESLHLDEIDPRTHLDVESLNVVAIVPVKGEVQYLGSRPLIEYTLEKARDSRYIKQIVVATDNEHLAKLAHEGGAHHVIMRPPHLSEEFVDIDDVVRFSLGELEGRGIYADVVMLLEVTFPFRPAGMIDELLLTLVADGLDSVMPARPEFRSCWVRRDGAVTRLDEGFLPRQYKEPMYIGLKGLGYVTYPRFVRDDGPPVERVGLVDVVDQLCALEVRDVIGLRLGEKLIEDWWKENR